MGQDRTGEVSQGGGGVQRRGPRSLLLRPLSRLPVYAPLRDCSARLREGEGGGARKAGAGQEQQQRERPSDGAGGNDGRWSCGAFSPGCKKRTATRLSRGSLTLTDGPIASFSPFPSCLVGLRLLGREWRPCLAGRPLPRYGGRKHRRLYSPIQGRPTQGMGV